MIKLSKLYKEMLQEKESKYRIYCDMDGVLCDFDTRFKTLNPDHISPGEYETKYGKEKFWDFIDVETGVKFWVGIPWMKDGKELWDFIKKYDPTLLSAPSKRSVSRLGKRLWVKNNIPGAKLILAYAENKKNYAKGPNDILIDDRADNIMSWESKGGTGIFHKDAASTIEALKKLGLE